MPGLTPRHLDPTALFAPLDEFARLGLAVSGGADSLALLLLAARHATTAAARARFFVYSVDHGLRPEAADEVAFVVREAERLGFAARPLRWSGPKPKTGLQQAAREARYALIAAAMRADAVPVLLTAHHLGDQAETVLMRLAHGSGLEGLRGMDYFSEVAGLSLVRPLLGIDPDALRQVVAEAGLTPVVDPSNSDAEYERVRWRQMLPQLAALGLDAARLSQFALRMRDADRALEHATARALADVSFSDGQGAATLDRDFLRLQPHAVAVRVVGHVLDRVGGGRKPHALAPVEALTDRLLREPCKTTLHGCVVTATGTEIRVAREGPRRNERVQAAQPSAP
jgi:tRNA(Ile)-lysidine synthase